MNKHWDFGWFCVAPGLLEKKELLAFFTSLSTIDTYPKDVIWKTLEYTYSALAELLREFANFWSPGKATAYEAARNNVSKQVHCDSMKRQFFYKLSNPNTLIKSFIHSSCIH